MRRTLLGVRASVWAVSLGAWPAVVSKFVGTDKARSY